MSNQYDTYLTKHKVEDMLNQIHEILELNSDGN